MSLRTEKVASLLQQIIVEPIREISKEYKAGLVTVTSVRVTEDLQLAKIYISVYGGKLTPMEVLEVLEDEGYRVKSAIASQARLRFVPEIKFYIDDTLDQIDRIQSLLDKAKDEE